MKAGCTLQLTHLVRAPGYFQSCRCRSDIFAGLEKSFTCCGNYYMLLPMIRSVYFQLRMLDICCVAIAGRIVPCNSLSVISKP